MSPVFGHGRLRLYLLKLLDEAPRHGYEVIRLLQDRFMGVYAPSPGTIYPRLARLEEEGFVTHDEEDGRKIYRITDKGRAEIHRRLDELDELEREITESVSGIAREVKEDVRETVRNLREELTWAARDMRGEGRQSAHERARQAREEAREHARQTREEMRESRARARDDTDERAGGNDEEAWAGREWGDWPGWQDWTRWSDWPGRRRGHPDRGGGGITRDFEALARELGNEVRRALRQAGALGEGTMEELRLILEDALARIRTDVFGPARPREEQPPSGESTAAEAGTAAAQEGTGSPPDTAGPPVPGSERREPEPGPGSR